MAGAASARFKSALLMRFQAYEQQSCVCVSESKEVASVQRLSLKLQAPIQTMT